jgi:hypothetical protein
MANISIYITGHLISDMHPYFDQTRRYVMIQFYFDSPPQPQPKLQSNLTQVGRDKVIGRNHSTNPINEKD